MKKLISVLLLSVLLVGCTQSQDAVLLDAIVTAAAGIAVATLPPADAQAILTYRNDVLTVVNDLVNNGSTINGIAAAAASLQAIKIPNVSAQGQAYISSIAVAVQNFVATYGTATPVTAAEAKKLKAQVAKARGRK